MSLPRTAPVVVGVNCSAASLAAVRTAAREAAMRSRPLRVVHAFAWPLYDASAGGQPYGVLRQQAAGLLDRAVAAARSAEPSVPVTGRLVDGWPARILLRESHGAALVVLGEDGLDNDPFLMVDSVVVRLVAHARCPVMVALGRARTAGPVVVGVDGSPASRLAVEFAFDEAARRHAPLTAVHAWEPETGPAGGAEAEQLLEETVRLWRDKYPEVETECRAVPGDPIGVLLHHSGNAQLLVIGPRGAGGRFCTLLGTAGQAVLRRCACPTIFVHASADVPHR
jgi:nucleotide-binding universal stress UspA family protein